VRHSGGKGQTTPAVRRDHSRRNLSERRSARLRRARRGFTGRFDALDDRVAPPYFRWVKLKQSLGRNKNHEHRNNRRLALRRERQNMIGSGMGSVPVVLFVRGNIRVVVQVQDRIQNCGNGIVQVHRGREMHRDVIDVESEKQCGQQTSPPACRSRRAAKSSCAARSRHEVVRVIEFSNFRLALSTADYCRTAEEMSAGSLPAGFLQDLQAARAGKLPALLLESAVR